MSITNHIDNRSMFLKEVLIDQRIYGAECHCTSSDVGTGFFKIYHDGAFSYIEDVYESIGKFDKRMQQFTYNAKESHSILLYKAYEQLAREMLSGETVTFQPGTIIFISNIDKQNLASYDQTIRRITQLLNEACSLPVQLLTEIFREELCRAAAANSLELGFLLIGHTEQETYPEFTLVLDSVMDSVEVGRIRVNQFLEQYTENLCLNLWCFQEMLVNAIEHGNQFAIEKKVTVHVQVRKEFVIFVITDEGNGFDWRKKIREESCLLSSSERGRGIVMSNMLCTFMVYNDSGNQVTLVFTLEK